MPAFDAQSFLDSALRPLCAPCTFSHMPTVEDMFPLEKLDEAVDARCMGLVLRDGSFAPGKAYGWLVPQTTKSASGSGQP